MRKHLFFTVAIVVLSLSFGSTLMAQQGQASRKNVRANVTENRPQAFPLFVDENGDGICDQFQDHDGDGVPNGLDPDWDRPEDGSGKQYGRTGEKNQGRFAHRNSFQEKGGNGQNKRSFRYKWNQSGSPAGDGYGSQSRAKNRGGK
jgi:hypothetical protein